MRTTTLAAYLLGHLDGLGEDLKIVPQVRCRLAESSYAPFVERLADAPRTLWSSREVWESRAVFHPLKEIAPAVPAAGGIPSRVCRWSGAYRNFVHTGNHPTYTGADAEGCGRRVARTRTSYASAGGHHRPAPTGIFQDFGMEEKGRIIPPQPSHR